MSGVIVSSQVSQYRSNILIPGDSMSIIKCHISGVGYQMSSDNMSSTGVRYQVSDIRCQVITCQLPGQISSVMYQVSSITCQVPVSDIKCQVSSVK